MTNCREYFDGFSFKAETNVSSEVSTSDVILFFGGIKPLVSEWMWERAQLRLSLLTDWIDLNPFGFKVSEDKNQGTLTFQRPPNWTARDEINGVILKVIPEYQWNRVSNSRQELQYEYEIVIESDIPKDADWFQQYAFKITEFFTLCIGQGILHKSLQLAIKDEGRDCFVYCLYGQEKKERKELKTAHYCPVNFREVMPNLTRCLYHFMIIHKTYEVILDNWMNSHFAAKHLVVNKFLLLVQALEGFHIINCKSGRCRSHYMDQNVWIKVLKEICVTLPETIDETVRQRMLPESKRFNELSLRDRLLDLAKCFPGVEAFDALQMDLAEFAKAIAAMRNSISHGSITDAQRKELAKLYVALYAFTTGVILGSIGFGVAVVSEAVSKVKHSVHVG